jgi:hypothetical protein
MRRVYLVPWSHKDHLETAKVIRVDDLRIPIHFCLGLNEAATQEELRDLITDLTHELDRR